MTKYLLSFPKHLMHPTCGAFPLSVRVAFPWWTTSVNPSVRLLQLPADLYMVYYYLLLLWASHSSGFLSYGLDGGWSPPQQDLYRCHYLLYLDDRWGPESLHWYPTIYLKSSQWRNGFSVPPVLGTCYSTKVPTTVRRRAKGNDWGVL